MPSVSELEDSLEKIGQGLTFPKNSPVEYDESERFRFIIALAENAIAEQKAFIAIIEEQFEPKSPVAAYRVKIAKAAINKLTRRLKQHAVSGKHVKWGK